MEESKELVQRFVLIKQLDSGSFGEVWIAVEQDESKKLVAIKINKDISKEADLLNEYEVMKEIDTH